MVFHIDSDQPIDLRAMQEAISEFSEKNQAYRVTGSFNVFEALSDFLSFAHIQLSNSHVPGKSSLISSPVLRKMIAPQSQQHTDQRVFTKKSGSMYDLASSRDELMYSGQNSPFFNGISGDIITKFSCNECFMIEEKQDNFMSLNFKLLQEDHVLQVRKRFYDEGYYEGIVTKVKETKNWKLFKIFSKKKEEPVLTIRDYLCYLNLVQTFQITQQCMGCNEVRDHTVTKLLQKAPEILIVGFSEPEEGLNGYFLDFRIDLEFDISPFVSQVENRYELIAVIAKEVGHFGIIGDVVYIKATNGKWLRIDM